jgi:hypothetical protein
VGKEGVGCNPEARQKAQTTPSLPYFEARSITFSIYNKMPKKKQS